MQLNLVVSDYLKVKLLFVRVIDLALEVIQWFNAHSRALGMLRKEMAEQLGKVYALILPAITRWTSHYLSCSRLLKIQLTLRNLVLYHRSDLVLCAGDKRDTKAKAEEILDIVAEPSFWRCLAEYVLQILPLIPSTNSYGQGGNASRATRDSRERNPVKPRSTRHCPSDTRAPIPYVHGSEV